MMKLVLMFGGPKLHYTLAKALDLPSVCTTQTSSKPPCIRPCVGFPKVAEITENLQSIHETRVLWQKGQLPRKRGLSILIDETAVEHRPKYDSDHDAVIGFSRLNASSCDMYSPTKDTLSAMVDGIQEGTLTRATEATVAAIAAFDHESYFPIPVLISGTCKHKTDMQQSKWISTIVKTFNSVEYGTQTYGEIWSIASDGDAVRRRELHRLCMAHTLSPSDPLFDLLGPLP